MTREVDTDLVSLRDFGGEGARWMVCVEGRPVGTVRASGRRKALAIVQRECGGQTQGTGSFYDVLLGSSLADKPVRILRPSEVRES